MTGKYDAANPPAFKRLIAGGVLLRAFSQDIMEASGEPGLCRNRGDKSPL